MKKIILICVTLFMMFGCSEVPEFKKAAAPPDPPAVGETITGKATWYGPLFHGRRTDDGGSFDMRKLTASHINIPFGSKVEVISPESGKKVQVVINDRHNLDRGHDICLSKKAAVKLGVYPKKTFPVNFTIIE